MSLVTYKLEGDSILLDMHKYCSIWLDKLNEAALSDDEQLSVRTLIFHSNGEEPYSSNLIILLTQEHRVR